MIGTGRVFITYGTAHIRTVWLCFVLMVLSIPSEIFAQHSENISSDRPGMSLASNTVGARVIQFQIGGQFNQSTFTNKFGNGFVGGAFDGAIRVGIIDRLEIGFSAIYNRRKREQVTNTDDTFENVRWSINLRGNVLKSDGRTPNIGLFAEVILPDKETDRFSESVSSQFRLLIQQPLEKRITLATNIGVYRDLWAHFIYTLNLSVDISPYVTIFAEHFGQYTQTYQRQSGSWPYEYEREKHYYARGNGGFAFQVIPNLQIDIEAGYGNWLIAPADGKDWNLNLGISWRTRVKKRVKKTEG